MTPDGLVLMQAHDLAQARLLDRGLAGLTLAFLESFKGVDLDVEAAGYLPLAKATVSSTRTASAQLSSAFYAKLRELEAPKAAPLPEIPPPPPVADELLETSLRVTGPVTAKSSLARGLLMDAALQTALTATLGSATRHIEGGGRDAMRTLVAGDPASRGWARRSGGRPCSFCAMLISRGPAYRSEGSASFTTHDHCHCKAVPFFGEDSGWTAQSREFRDLYDASLKHPTKDFHQLYRERYPRLKSPTDTHDEALRSNRARKAAETRKAKKATPATPATPEPATPAPAPAPKAPKIPSLTDVPQPADVVDLADQVEKTLHYYKTRLRVNPRELASKRSAEIWTRYKEGLTRHAPATSVLEATLSRYPKGVSFTPEELRSLTNPRYSFDERARINCVHVSNTYELQRRGYAVTASPLPKSHGNSGRDAQEALFRWRDANGDPRLFTKSSTTRLTKTLEKEWPDGARGFITVQWKGGGGHIFNVEKTPTGVRYYEAQSNREITFDGDYGPLAKRDSVRYVRVDDLTPTDDVLEFTQEGHDAWKTSTSTGRAASA